MMMVYKCYQWILLVAALQNICTAQVLADCNEASKCNEMDECILQYTELEEYILSNKTILNSLTKAFFRADKPVITKFLRITYNMQISDRHNDSEYLDDINTCTGFQSVYIWSKAPFYLLGPRPLFFLTLFAVDVAEISITIALPCLCKDEVYSLLSQLTYMVRKAYMPY